MKSLTNSINVNNFTNGYYYLNFTTEQLDKYIFNGACYGKNNLSIFNGIIIIEKLPTQSRINIFGKIIVGDTITIESKLIDKFSGKPNYWFSYQWRIH